MDIGTFAMGCMNYEINIDNGNLPEHDIEFNKKQVSDQFTIMEDL